VSETTPRRVSGKRTVTSDVRTYDRRRRTLRYGIDEQNSRREPVPNRRGLRRIGPRGRPWGRPRRRCRYTSRRSARADAIDIKDAVYDGDIVIADITRLRTGTAPSNTSWTNCGRSPRRSTATSSGRGEDQMIITPTGIHISREKLGQKLCRVGYWTTSHVLFSALRLLSSRTHSFAFSAVAIAQLPRW